MATKIRLQRHGRKKRAFFHIVVADSRAPRDGRFIEKIGTYNPITNPATIDINLEKAVQWMAHGAQPSDTARAILSYKGVLYKHHLQVGVRKGAITQEQADAKFAEWMTSKDAKIAEKRSSLEKASNSRKSDAMKAEAQKREAIAARVLAKQSAATEEIADEAEAIETEASAEVTETIVTEETATEEAPAEEAASEETAVEETVAEEPATEEPTAEETASEESEPAEGENAE
ncbi:MAG: 30S ribosomal protein S16 [Sphingomonadales bacterium]|jgi:small subunit ribosomal protein S16